MTAEHRRPFAAFLLVFAFACVIMANGLRDQVVEVFVELRAPRPLITAVLPDIVLGHSLRDAPPAPQPRPRPRSSRPRPGARGHPGRPRGPASSALASATRPPNAVDLDQRGARQARQAAAAPAPTAPVQLPTAGTPTVRAPTQRPAAAPSPGLNPRRA